MWQRLVRRVAAVSVIIVGAFGTVPAIPGILLIVLGLLLLFCFYEASEDWEMTAVHRCYGWFKRLFIRKPPATGHMK